MEAGLLSVGSTVATRFLPKRKKDLLCQVMYQSALVLLTLAFRTLFYGHIRLCSSRTLFYDQPRGVLTLHLDICVLAVCVGNKAPLRRRPCSRKVLSTRSEFLVRLAFDECVKPRMAIALLRWNQQWPATGKPLVIKFLH